MNSSDLIHYIIKFGMLKKYPDFHKHFQDVLNNNDKKVALRKFIEEIADQRVNQANDLIEAYHRKSEVALNMMQPTATGEKLYAI